MTNWRDVNDNYRILTKNKMSGNELGLFIIHRQIDQTLSNWS